MEELEPAEEEIAAIRRELDTLRLEMAAASPRSSSLASHDAALQNDNSEMDIKCSLDYLHRRLTQEKAQRKQLEDELHLLRLNQKQMTTESLEAMNMKREELMQLTRERDELREWLQRGVNECRRVADEALRLKRDLEERTQRCQLLENAKEELREKMEIVQKRLVELQSQLEELREKERVLEAYAGEHALTEQKLMEMNEKRQKEYEALQAEVESRQHRVEQLESAEMSIQLLTERLQQLLSHMERLGKAIRKGCVEDVLADEFFLHENVAEPQHPLNELLVRAKTLPHTIAVAIQQLHGDIAAFTAEQQCLLAEQAAKQREHLEALHMEKQTVLHKYEKEKETMMQEIAQLQTELLRAVTKLPTDGTESPNLHKERIVELEELLRSNSQQAEENEKLRRENDELRGKLRSLKIDWKKVHESQLRFQQLQVEVEMIARTNERVQKENESLKMQIETCFSPLPKGVQSEHELQEKHGYLGVNGRAKGVSFARPSVSTVRMGSTDVRRGRSASSSASNADSRRSEEREVFQEWKHMVMSGYLE